jgi:(2Fe-2S) ferredoxin
VTDRTHPERPADTTPGLTACSLCAGETLEGVDPLPGGQRVRLERLAATGVARLTLTECLDRCERGDVVVARPSPRGRTCAGRPVWFERLAGDALTRDLASWLTAGGPGLAPVPASLEPLRIGPDAGPDADQPTD